MFQYYQPATTIANQHYLSVRPVYTFVPQNCWFIQTPASSIVVNQFHTNFTQDPITVLPANPSVVDASRVRCLNLEVEASISFTCQ